MARTFKVEVDGQEFEVRVEEVGGKSGPAVQASPQVAAPSVSKPQASAPVKKAPAPEKPQPQSKPQTADGNAVNAPLPGTVTEIVVSVGQSVTVGQKLMVLEAMKMENDIAAPSDGTVKQILVAKGDAVQSGQSLIVFE